MSYSVDQRCDIYVEEKLAARKQHKCNACDEQIEPGHHYVRIFMLFDGEKSTVKRCARCQKIHDHLKTLGEIAALVFALPGETK